MRKYFWLFLVLLLLSSSTGVMAEYDDVIAAAEALEYDRALQLIQRLRLEEPENYKHARMEALVYRSLWNNFPENVEPDQSGAVHRQSLLLFREALELAGKYGADDQVLIEIYHRIARAHLAAGEYEEARRTLATVLSKHPNDVMTNYWMGEVYMADFESNKHSSRAYLVLDYAVGYYDTAIKENGGIQPRLLIPDAYYHMGMYHYEFSGNWELAVTYLQIWSSQIRQLQTRGLERWAANREERAWKVIQNILATN